MSTTLRTGLALAAAIAVAALAAVLLAPRFGDPTAAVPAVEIGDFTPDGEQPLASAGDPVGVQPTASAPAVPGATIRPVTALEELAGTLQRIGDDADDYGVGRTDLDFGPEAWVVAAPADGDYDRDGTAEQLDAELEGLLGQEVRLLVRFDDDRDDADVYTINELAYRDVSGGPPPWQLAEQAAALAEPPIDRATAGDLAAAAVGEGARPTDIDAGDDFPVAWEVEVLAADGRAHEVLLDAVGQILDRRDDH